MQSARATAPLLRQLHTRRILAALQRLARAHANCVEGLPLFGGLLVVALLTGQQALTDPLALVLLAARVAQSSVHLASLSVPAVNLRFACFALQMGIAAYWALCLLAVLKV